MPAILNTRITVEQIAGYFKESWGVAEIEAAIQYYLNHRAEIERDLRRSLELYEADSLIKI